MFRDCDSQVCPACQELLASLKIEKVDNYETDDNSVQSENDNTEEAWSNKVKIEEATKDEVEEGEIKVMDDNLPPSPKPDKKIECTACEKQFSSKKWFLKHRSKCDESNHSHVSKKPVKVKRHECSECEKKFSSVACYVKHAQKKHKLLIPKALISGKKNCPFCKKWFNPVSQRFVSHLKIIHSAERENPLYLDIVNNQMEKKYICQDCGSSFTFQNNLTQHMLKQHGSENRSVENSLSCHECGKNFKNINSLKVHMKYHKTENCLCNECGSTFQNASKLQRHRTTHTQELIPCSECGKLFKTLIHLKRHVRFLHRKLKTAQCDQCDKRFPDISKLRSHISSVHSKVKPYVCEVCGFKCARVDNLNLHRRKSHGMANALTRVELALMVEHQQHPFCTLADLPMLQLQNGKLNY